MTDADSVVGHLRIDAVVGRHPNTLVRSVADEVLLFQPLTNELIAADPTATRIWHALETPISLAELISTVASDFAVTPDVIASDVGAFVSDLVRRGALQVESG